MSTIQIAGIAVATVIVVLLVVALFVTRKSGGTADQAADESARSSFLDSPPSDTLARLGKPEHTAPEPAVGAAPPAVPEGAPEAPGAAGAAAGGLGLGWDAPGGQATTPPAGTVEDGETTGEMPVAPAEPGPAAAEPEMQTEEPAATEAEPVTAAEAEPEAAAEPVTAAEAEPEAAAEPVTAAEAEPQAAAEPVTAAEEVSATDEEPAAQEAVLEAPMAEEPLARAAATSDRVVPLSSIIVTTSTKMVDLDDPEIRRMLADLVTFEIDQATQFREQGQNLDAVLQLTEAEKICRALGKEDTAREIRDMMRGLQA